MKNNRTHRIKLLLFAFFMIACMTAIFLFSCQNADESSQTSEGFIKLLGDWICSLLPRLTSQGIEHDIRKYAHMAEYMCLGISAALFFVEWLNRKLIGLSAAYLFCLFYASTDEWHQTFVPGRSGSIRDVGIDSIGFGMGILAVFIIMMVLDTRKRKIRE